MRCEHPIRLSVSGSSNAERALPNAWRRQPRPDCGGRAGPVQNLNSDPCRRSAESIALKRQMRSAFVQLRDMVRATNAELRETEARRQQMLRRFGR